MVYLGSVTDSNPTTSQSEDCYINKTNVALTTATAAVIIKGLFVFFLALAECSKREREPGQAVYCYEADISATDIVSSIGAIAFATLIGRLAN